MAKTARTYRLSDAALEAVAQRDRAKYPAANDFVEARILEAEKEKKEDEVLQKISGIEKNLERVLGFLAGKKGAVGIKPNFDARAPSPKPRSPKGLYFT